MTEPRSTPRELRVLIVDDDGEMRRVARLAAVAHGWTAVEAEDGIDALATLATEPVDVVLLDLAMPGLSGIEVLQSIRANPKLAGLPVLVITASDDAESTVAALDAGADDYVTKPFQVAVLGARIRAQLRRAVAAPPAASTGPLRLEPGEIVAGKYRLVRELGRGGQGTVWEAEQAQLERQVAIKFLSPDTVRPEDLEALTRREGVHASRVEHPGAVAVYDFDLAADGTPFLVMELLRGQGLDAALTRRGPLIWGTAAEVFAQVADALAAAHEAGVVHRDVKPANIFLHASAGGPRPKLLDFGIAQRVGATTVRGQARSITGTPDYLAPECVRGGTQGPATDMYGFGATLFHALAGRAPFRESGVPAARILWRHLTEPPPSVGTLAPEVPPALELLLNQLLAKEPGERPTAAQAADRLRALGSPARRTDNDSAATLIP